MASGTQPPSNDVQAPLDAAESTGTGPPSGSASTLMPAPCASFINLTLQTPLSIPTPSQAPSSSTPTSLTPTPFPLTLAQGQAHANPPRRPWHRLIRSDFWFVDGNIVLIAGNAIFKVHRGQLERQSEVFRDLFSVPLPPGVAVLGSCHQHRGRTESIGVQQQQDALEQEEQGLGFYGEQDLIEGCHWIELHDPPLDVFYFLAALYDGLYFKSPPTSADFPSLSAVLRLSTKYLVEPLRRLCLRRLHHDWPTTLAAWDAREREAVDWEGRYNPRDVCCHPILFMELVGELGGGGGGGGRNVVGNGQGKGREEAEEVELEAMLPAAFYDLARYGPSKIMAGATSLYDGAVIIDLEQSTMSGAEAEERSERTVVLNREMLGRTFRGREKAQRYISDFVARELENRLPASGCAGRTVPSLSSHPTATESDGESMSGVGVADVKDSSRKKDDVPSRACLESFYFIMLNILRSVGGIACGRDADPLFTLVQATEMLSRTDFSDGRRTTGLKICHACKVDFKASVAKAREDVWNLLPVWFGLVTHRKEKVQCPSLSALD